MIKSKRYYKEECINKFEKLKNKFLKNPTEIAEYVIGLTTELRQLGLQMIGESLELMAGMQQSSSIRKKNWSVESHSMKQLVTSLGTVHFSKTSFVNKKLEKVNIS